MANTAASFGAGAVDVPSLTGLFERISKVFEVVRVGPVLPRESDLPRILIARTDSNPITPEYVEALSLALTPEGYRVPAGFEPTEMPNVFSMVMLAPVTAPTDGAMADTTAPGLPRSNYQAVEVLLFPDRRSALEVYNAVAPAPIEAKGPVVSDPADEGFSGNSFSSSGRLEDWMASDREEERLENEAREMVVGRIQATADIELIGTGEPDDYGPWKYFVVGTTGLPMTANYARDLADAITPLGFDRKTTSFEEIVGSDVSALSLYSPAHKQAFEVYWFHDRFQAELVCRLAEGGKLLPKIDLDPVAATVRALADLQLRVANVVRHIAGTHQRAVADLAEGAQTDLRRVFEAVSQRLDLAGQLSVNDIKRLEYLSDNRVGLHASMNIDLALADQGVTRDGYESLGRMRILGLVVNEGDMWSISLAGLNFLDDRKALLGIGAG